MSFVLSSWRVVSFDEHFWLAIARRIPHGDLPYLDLLDNKGPLLYLTVLVVDLLPGSYRFGRALVVGMLVLFIGLAGSRVARAAGTGPRVSYAAGALASFLVGLLSTYALTTEILAAALVVSALACVASRPVAATSSIVAAAAIDPRAILFILPMAVLASHAEGRQLRTVLMVGGSACVAAGLLLGLVPDLRFALVELSTATRFLDSYYPDQQAWFASMVLLPVVTYLVFHRITRSGFQPWQLLVIASAVSIAAASLFPFGHYWTYVPLALIVIPIEASTVRKTATAFLVALLTAVPLARSIRAEITRDERQSDALEEVRSTLPTLVDAEEKVVIWSGFPHLASALPDNVLGPSPSINYLGWQTSRRVELLERFAADLQEADVVVVEATLDSQEISDGYRSAASLVLDEIQNRNCVTTVAGAGVTLNRKTGEC